jgi:hypothetical protein
VIGRLLHHPTAREVRGYLILGGLVAITLSRAAELRRHARWAVHAAAALVPEPDEEPE